MSSTAHEKPVVDVLDSGFFVLRTPTLPLEEFYAWTNGLTTRRAWESSDAAILERAWKEDVQILRSRLRQILDRPEITHALFVASPSLEPGIEDWKKDPISKKGRQAERTLVRYFQRMATRPMPFGLFSGCSLGRIGLQGEPAALVLAPRAQYRSCTRPDFDYLFALTAGLQRDPAVAAALCYSPNSSLHKVAGSWHYVESKVLGSRRSHHLVKVESDEFLETVLERARPEARLPELVAAVLHRGNDSSISEAEALEYVHELIHSGVLVSNLLPLVTGGSPLDDIIATIQSIPQAEQSTETLKWFRNEISVLDSKGLGASGQEYRRIAEKLDTLPAKTDIACLFQVDLIKPVQSAVLSQPVIEELIKGVDVLYRLGQTAEPEALHAFRDAFSARYDRAVVPLLEALDEEAGLGFGGPSSDSSPLLRGLTIGAAGGFASRETPPVLMRRLLDGYTGSLTELALDITDLPAEEGRARYLPDSFAVMATLIAASTKAIDQGDFLVRIDGCSGPDGARLFGRLCHADAELKKFVMHHLRQEEALQPDAVFAEIVHLPEGRIGNVLCRPVLRDYEIVYLGRSGAPLDHQLPVSDLLLSIEDDQVIVHSQRLGRRIIPRLSNAHGFPNPKLSAVYRFLCHLQHALGVGIPGFSWGPLESLDYLPRLRVGRLILAVARWRLKQQEIIELGKQEGSFRFAAVQELRDRRRLPRWVVLEEVDNALLFDLDNALSVDAFVHVLKRGGAATLRELYPTPEQLCVTGPEGRFFHELHVPFVRRARIETDSAAPRTTQTIVPVQSSPRETRLLAPGSEWLYVKLYGGFAVLDEVLTKALPSIVENGKSAGALTRWFFIRYSDPHQHLRIRFQGPPANLMQSLMPMLSAAINPLLNSGELWKIQFDTYEREIERYGGLEGTIAAEELFHADSEAVIEILKQVPGDAGQDQRWRIALLGMDALLSDCGLDLEAKRNAVKKQRDSFHGRFQVGVQVKKEIGDRYRTERRRLECLFETDREQDEQIDLARKVLARRSSRIAGVSSKLRALAAEGRLRQDIAELAFSYVHLFINRLIRFSSNAHEMVLYDFLFRLYDGELARAGKNSRRMGAEEIAPEK